MKYLITYFFFSTLTMPCPDKYDEFGRETNKPCHKRHDKAIIVYKEKEFDNKGEAISFYMRGEIDTGIHNITIDSCTDIRDCLK